MRLGNRRMSEYNLTKYIHTQEINSQGFQLRLGKDTISEKLLQILGAQRKLRPDNASIRCGTKLASRIERLKTHEYVFVNQLPACNGTRHPWM